VFLTEILNNIFELFYDITSSYGLSIILLSLAVTIIMVPLFWIAEKLQNIERARKVRMQPALDGLKDITNKQEKYYYTRRIYRQYKYSPFYSLTGLLGLLIQIPFFIAAYWFLLEYAPLEGVSYGPIKDLFQPDGLFFFGGMTINLLPFVMTIVNLFVGYLYAKNRSKSEQIQLIVIAFIFLVLLYNMSAALVLYWTMNNVFAIGKNWFIKKIPDKLLSNNVELKVFNLFKVIYAFTKKSDYIIYVVFMGLFPLFSFYYSNIGELYFSSIWLILLLTILSHTLLSLIAKFIFKDNSKVILFGFLTVIIVFSFGHVFDYFSDQFMNTRRRYFYLVYLAVGVYGSIIIFKTKLLLQPYSKTLKLLSVFMLVAILSQIMIYNLINRNNTGYVNADMETSKVKINDTITASDQYPDIYYIVLDGYANSKILSDYHDFDNSSFENNLKNKGFYIAVNSRANYVITYLSSASTLNMEHLNYLKKERAQSRNYSKLVYQMIRKNKVIAYLKNKGYKTAFFRSGWGLSKPDQYDYIYGNPATFSYVALNYLATTLFEVITTRGSINYRDNILYTFDKLAEIDEIGNNSPKFVYAHIVSPHPPYVFDEDGGYDMENFVLDNEWSNDDKKHYLKQLQYLNNRTEELIDSLLKKPKETVIILQSDHGPAFMGYEKDWNNSSIEGIRERSLILNAILLNDSNVNNLYPEVSSVNTFRVVFNNVFNDSLEILHDSTYFSSYETPFNFFNVTDKLLK
jgi:YidC/Oxa1 family membrane protein insertase